MKAGVDLGGTKVQAVVVNDRFVVQGQARRATPTTGGPAAVIAEVAAAIRDAAEAAGTEPSALTGVGVGAPGAVDSEAGTVAEAGNLPDWQEPFAFRPALEKALNARVVLANDVEVAVEAEFRLGAGKPYSSLLGVFWGSGIGGGMVLDGKSWRGRGAAGEIGHMVIKRNGARCPCGRRGCVEAYAGRTAMERRARKLVNRGARTELFEIMEQRGRERLTSAVWAHALEKGDRLAVQLIDRAVAALGAGVASALNLLDVEAVVIGGGLGTRFGQPFVEKIEQEMMKHLFVPERPPAVLPAALGDLGGAIGASLLVG